MLYQGYVSPSSASPFTSKCFPPTLSTFPGGAASGFTLSLQSEREINPLNAMIGG